MPRRTDIHSILIIGTGPIVIGQACEFDYSGTQACKALREEGFRVVLVNSNPATIMTDPEMADSTYIEPITVPMLERIIEAEKPDAILPTLGGQTGLNIAIQLADTGILDRHGVRLIGADREAIRKAEDRSLFKQAMARHRHRRAAKRPRPFDGGGPPGRRGDRLSPHHPAVLHPGRDGRRRGARPGALRGDGGPGPGARA